MKQKKKRAILASIAIFALVTITAPVIAAPSDRGLPAESDPFWDFFEVMSRPDDTATCLAKVTELSADPNSGVDEHYSQFCYDVANMPSQMESDMASEEVSTNLFDASNWHNISGLYFQKTKNGQLMGKISFSKTIDFLTYRFFTFMNNFPNMVQFEDGYISLNSAMVGDMAYYGATLTMYNLDQFAEQPDIYVTAANRRQMKKALEGVDISDITWDDSTKSLSFSPSHFSAFRVVQKGSKLKKMKITSVTKRNIKYNVNKSTFTVKVKGRNLKKAGADISCVLGFEQAQKVRASRNGKRVICTFQMSDFSTLGYYPLTISIPGAGEVTKANAVRIR